MNKDVVLHARNTNAPAPLPAPAPRPMSEIIEQASMLAQSGEVVPKAYRGNTGACMLALDLATNMQRPILWVLQNVAFINGKPIVEANGVVEIAAENDYTITLDEVTDKECTVTLVDDRTGEKVGTWTSTMADANTRNPVWKSHPKHMLRANAIRNLWKFHGRPRGGAYLVSADEIVELDQPDPVAVLTGADEAPEPMPGQTNLLGEPDDAGGFPELVTPTQLKDMIAAAGLKQGDVLKAHPGMTLDDICADPDLLDDVVKGLEG